MADFNFINRRIATGGAVNSAADAQALIQAGVTHVIDCRAEFDDAPFLASDPQMGYLWDGVFDDGLPKPTSWFGKGIDFALSALSKPGTKVYAHCAAGVNRGPSMALAILMALGQSRADAEAAIRKARPQVGLAYADGAEQAVAALGY